MLLRTRVGREKLLVGSYYGAWPLFCLAAWLYRRLLVRRTRVIAVVGSFGKTTTTRAINVALGKPVFPLMEGNSFSALAGRVLRIRPTDRQAVLEVSITGPGVAAGYAELVRPQVVVVTSIGSEHNRSFGTLETTRHEKAELVRALPRDGLAILNGDDPHVRWMASQTQAQVVTFGFDPRNDLRAIDLGLDWPHGRTFELHVGGQVHRVKVRLLGRHQVTSFLAAVAVARAEGLDLATVLPRLEALEPLQNRLAVVPLPNGAYLLRDDFKSGLETIDAALDLLAEIPARRIVVLGGVTEPTGSQGAIYRRLGQRVAGIAARAIFVGTNYERYAVGARSAGMARESIVRARTAADAAAWLEQTLAPGDVVLIKGRHEERLERVALRLQGQVVRCDIRTCYLKWTNCSRCRMLEQAWEGLPPPA